MRIDLFPFVLRLILVSALGFVSPTTGADAAHDQVTASITRFGALYAQGHLRQAIDGLPGILKDLEGLVPYERIAIYGTLDDVCLDYYQFDCVRKMGAAWQEALTQLVQSPAPDRQQLVSAREDFFERLVRMNVQSNGKDWLRENLHQLIEFAPDPQGTMDFDRTNLTIAQAFLLLDDPGKAAFYVRRGWLHLISTQHLNAHRYAELMPAYSLLFFQLGQLQRGDAATVLMRPELLRLGSFNKYTALTLAQVDLLQANFTNTPALAIDAAHRALKLLDEVEGDDNMRQGERMSVLSEAVIMCLLNPSQQCQLNEWLPLLEKTTERIAPLYSEGGYDELRLSGVAMAMGQVSRNQPPSELVQRMCGLPLMSGDSLFAQADRSTQLACQYFMAVARSDPDSSRLAIEAARNEIGRMRRFQQLEPFEIGPLNIYTRAVLLIAATAELKKSDRDFRDDELLLEIAALVNRTQQSVETQYIQLLAHVQDRNEALNLQALHRIEQNLFRQEKIVLDRQTKAQGSPGQLDQLNIQDWVHLANLAQMTLDRNEVKAKAGEAFQSQWALLDQLFATLRPDERFITAFPALGAMIHLCASPSAFVAGSAPLDPIQTLIDLKTLRAALTNPNPPTAEADSHFPFAESRRVTRLFLGEGAECVGDSDHLIIAPPPGQLRTIPLAILYDQADPRSSRPDRIDDAPWLGLNRALSTMVDAQELISSRQLPRESASMPYLGIGDPLLTGTTQDGQPRQQVALRGVKRGAAAADLSSLEALPDTKNEIEFMSRQFGPASKALLSADATEANMRRQPLSDYQVIDFATHGLVREEIEGITEPALILTPGDSRSETDNGVLTATKISELDLSADLVVLSACNSARFDLDVFGPEAASLSTAFFMAGARSTVASLWSVDSYATAHLMEDFGSELAHHPGAGPAFSLRAAVRSFLRSPPSPEYRHPRFWAAFSTYGDGGVRRASSNSTLPALRLTESNSQPVLGEIDFAQAVAKGKVLTIGFHDTDHPRVAGDLLLLDHGAVAWKVSDADFSFVPVQSEKPGLPPILAWNSVNGVFNSELRWYSEAGKVLRKQVLPSWPRTLATELLELPSGFVVAGISSGDQPQVQLRMLDRNGHIRSEQPVPLISAAAVSSVRLLKGRAGIWLTISEFDSTRTGRFETQPFGTGLYCNAYSTELHLLGPDLQDLVPPRVLRDVEIADIARETGGDIAALTIHDGCNTINHAVAGIARLTPQGEIIDQRMAQTGFPTEARRLVRTASGVLTMVGAVHRDLDPDEAPAKSDDDYGSSAMLRRESAARQVGLFAVPVSRSGEIGTPDLLFLGGNFFVGDGLAQESGNLMIVGSNNYRQFTGELSQTPGK